MSSRSLIRAASRPLSWPISFLHHQHPQRQFNNLSHHFLGSSPRRSPTNPNQINTITMAATDATLKTFFESSKFAVVGASTNPDKFGHKIFKWYVNHGLDVKPVNPIAKAIKVDNADHETVASLSDLSDPTNTSISIITGPAVTTKALAEAKELGIPAVFLQPGTFDDAILAFARENFKAVVAGEGGTGPQGWCVLADGERGLKAAGKA